MSEFKSGDKVITTAQGGWYEVGDVLTLTKPYKDYGWYTVEKGEGFFVDIAKIEHYKQSPKNMLKNGMRVRLRNDLLCTYIDGYFTNIRTKNGGLIYLTKVDEWGDNLNYYVDGGECEWDVMEIFAATGIYDYFNYGVETKSLWKREEKTPQQLELESLQQQAQDIANRIKALQDKL